MMPPFRAPSRRAAAIYADHADDAPPLEPRAASANMSDGMSDEFSRCRAEPLLRRAPMPLRRCRVPMR